MTLFLLPYRETMAAEAIDFARVEPASKLQIRMSLISGYERYHSDRWTENNYFLGVNTK